MENGNHYGTECHVVVVDCLITLTMKVDFSISKVVQKYILGISSFHVHNVTKETCPYRAEREQLSDFDGVQDWGNRPQLTESEI